MVAPQRVEEGSLQDPGVANLALPSENVILVLRQEASTGKEGRSTPVMQATQAIYICCFTFQLTAFKTKILAFICIW